MFLVAAGLGGGALYAKRIFHMPGPDEAPIVAVAPRGSLDEVAATLVHERLASGKLNFRLAAFLTRNEGPIRAGEFLFPAHASLRDTLTVLRTAKPVQHSLTIPEGRTAKQIAMIFARADLLTGPVTLTDAALLLPQTYLYERGAPASAIVARGQMAMAKVLEQEWAGRAPLLPLASPQEALVLASIIERETALAEERPHVAAVFLNRLRAGMRLQSDPTVVYGASDGLGVLDRALSRADLDRHDPYNTYRITGLPPGPIAAPGIATLHAALHPAISEDLYFVADGNGGHVFAATLEDHNRNVAKYRALTAGR